MSEPEKPSWPASLLDHPATTAFGAATIVLLKLLAPLASPTHDLFYHLSGPVSVIVVPVLLNFAAVWLALVLLLVWSRRHPRFGGWVSAVLSTVLAWLLLRDWAWLHSAKASVPPSAVLLFAVIVCLAVGFRLALGSRSETIFRHALALCSTLLGFVALSGVVLLAQVLCFSWQARNLNLPRQLHRPSAQHALDAHESSRQGHTSGRPHGRILWIVFDELSYRQLYEHRFPGVQLPAFDRLAATSTVFTQTVPAGMYTELVLPSLLTGREIDRLRTDASGLHVELHNASAHRWGPLDPQDTVFGDALDAGYSTSVAGWFNPYCRILPQVLDHCFWISHIPLGGAMLPQRSILFNAMQPLLHHLIVAAEGLHLRPHASVPPPEIISHKEDYDDLAAATQSVLEDPSATFALLHLPIPHPGGIYNRHTSTFALDQPSYLNNLVLCDLLLAHLRQQLERSGEWDDTTIVIMADHSWRVWMWANAPGWTTEEQAASHGNQFDGRPAYIVKLPHQNSPARIETPFAALRTRALLDNLIDGRIENTDQLSKWAALPN